MIKFNCGKCDQRLHVKDEAAGKKVKCPKCGVVCAVPEVQPLDASESSPATSATSGTGQPTAEPVGKADAAPPDPSWYYLHGGEKYGPVPSSVIREKIKAGELSHTIRIWREGMDEWQELAAVAEFRDLVPHSPPPPVPPPTQTPSVPVTPHASAAPVQATKGNGLAIAGMVLGIVSMFLGYIIWFIALPCILTGLVLSVVGLNKAKAVGTGRGMAVAGLVLTTIALVCLVIFMSLDITMDWTGALHEERDGRNARSENLSGLGKAVLRHARSASVPTRFGRITDPSGQPYLYLIVRKPEGYKPSTQPQFRFTGRDGGELECVREIESGDPETMATLKPILSGAFGGNILADDELLLVLKTFEAPDNVTIRPVK